MIPELPFERSPCGCYSLLQSLQPPCEVELLKKGETEAQRGSDPAQLMPAESLRVRDKRQTQDSHGQAAEPQNRASEHHAVPVGGAPAQGVRRECRIVSGAELASGAL